MIKRAALGRMVKLFKRQKTSFEHEHVRLSFFYSFLELNQKFVFTLFFVFRLKSGNLRLLAGACDVSTVHRSSAFWKRETTRFVELWQLFECSSIQRLSGVDRMERMRVEKEVSGVSRILVVWWRVCGGSGKPRKSWLGFPKRQGRPAFPSFSGLYKRSFLQVFLGFPVHKRTMSEFN